MIINDERVSFPLLKISFSSNFFIQNQRGEFNVHSQQGLNALCLVHCASSRRRRELALPLVLLRALNTFQYQQNISTAITDSTSARDPTLV